MTWKIITDSGSDFRSISDITSDISFEVVPLILNIDHQIYHDTTDLDISEMIQTMTQSQSASTTACPAPDSYVQAFKDAENILCFTLSSQISGSYNSASLAKDLVLEENPKQNIQIIDSRSAGAEIDLLILKAIELIQANHSFETVISEINHFHEKTKVNFLLESVDSLVKNGRVSKIIGQMIGLLGIRLIGKRSPEGTIELAQKTKGIERAYKALIREMEKNGFDGGQVVISHVQNHTAAEELANLIREIYPQTELLILPCSGLCSFYAQDKGLIIGYHQ